MPTEAEWEYACRAGTTGLWHGASDKGDMKAIANIADASLETKHAYFSSWVESWNDGYPFTAPVGRFAANKFGLHDMHGNVMEWCSDWLDKKYDSNSPRNDPSGPETGSERVIRGGGWINPSEFCRSAIRGGFSPSERYFSLGFRLAHSSGSR